VEWRGRRDGGMTRVVLGYSNQYGTIVCIIRGYLLFPSPSFIFVFLGVSLWWFEAE
jgi:hypothetical protein